MLFDPKVWSVRYHCVCCSNSVRVPVRFSVRPSQCNVASVDTSDVVKAFCGMVFLCQFTTLIFTYAMIKISLSNKENVKVSKTK